MLLLPICKRAFPWWIQKKPWFLAALSSNYIDVQDSMIKHKMFWNAKAAAELVQVYVYTIYKLKEHNPSMLSNVEFWKRIFQANLNVHDTRICMDIFPDSLKENAILSEGISAFQEKIRPFDWKSRRGM